MSTWTPPADWTPPALEAIPRPKRKGGRACYTAALKRAFGGKCLRCGHAVLRFLDFAHIRPTPISRIHRGRGLPNRYHDIVRNLSAYILLCRWCHRVFDAPYDQEVGPLPQLPHNGSPDEPEEDVA